jgi:hypothetical protein
MNPLTTPPPDAPWTLVATVAGSITLLVILVGIYVGTWRWKP